MAWISVPAFSDDRAALFASSSQKAPDRPGLFVEERNTQKSPTSAKDGQGAALALAIFAAYSSRRTLFRNFRKNAVSTNFGKWALGGGAMFFGRLGLALVLVMLCLGGRAAHAQATAVPYWLPSWPLGFGGNAAFGQSPNFYDSFGGSDARGGVSNMRYDFSNGWFVGSEGGAMGLSMNGFNQVGAPGNFSPYYEGVQFGYNFQNAAGLPLRVFAGFDTLKYKVDTGSPFAPFDSQSGTLPGYSAHAGVEFRPTSNLSLSLGVGFAQQPAGDINSALLPGVSPFTGRH
jgi:opacity protein-like surface antigen